jgi:GTP-binding protein
MLVDSARITVRAGRGGDGCASFRREKFVPRGGPNGGDGGRGGDVVFRTDEGFNTLLHIHNQRIVQAKHGNNGEGSNKTGAKGASVVLPVPVGTVVTDHETGEVLGDLTELGQELVAARGGRGGRGNARFRTSTHQAPRTAENGRPGEERELHLELKLLADVGLVGLPNAGKSTLLSRLSAARPKVADYPFTTLEPHLGVVQGPGFDHETLVMADIPGLIEGAHAGAGLGTQFLQHIERCRVLLHLVDLSAEEPLESSVLGIRAELAANDPPLDDRRWMLVGTKTDALAGDSTNLDALAGLADRLGVESCSISAATGDGVPHLVARLFELARRPVNGEDEV